MLESEIKEFNENSTRSELAIKLKATLFKKYKDLTLDAKPKESSKKMERHPLNIGHLPQQVLGMTKALKSFKIVTVNSSIGRDKRSIYDSFDQSINRRS